MQPIFIGDVQGCLEELEELVQRAVSSFGNKGFRVLLVGDLVNRGPSSLGVLRRVREWCEAGRAETVLGNHDLGLIEAALGLREPGPTDTFQDVLEAPDCDEWIDWLRTRPPALTGSLGKARFALVHAAVPPGWSAEQLEACSGQIGARLGGPRGAARRFLAASPEADPDRDALGLLTRCRSIDRRGRWRAREPERPRDAWYRHWRDARPDYGVVYGHWATQGLHCDESIRGLDTGCVHHGRGTDGFLTAWVPDLRNGKAFSVPERGALWQVRARQPWFRRVLDSLPDDDSA